MKTTELIYGYAFTRASVEPVLRQIVDKIQSTNVGTVSDVEGFMTTPEEYPILWDENYFNGLFSDELIIKKVYDEYTHTTILLIYPKGLKVTPAYGVVTVPTKPGKSWGVAEIFGAFMGWDVLPQFHLVTAS